MFNKMFMAFFFSKTNYIPHGGTVDITLDDNLDIELDDQINITICGSDMALIDSLSAWFESDTVAWTGTVSGLPTGADPTDYTIKFDVTRDGVILQTLSATLNSSAAYSISDTLGAGVTAGMVQVYASLWWDSSSDYYAYFDKLIEPRPAVPSA
jgi:hypothetical protein